MQTDAHKMGREERRALLELAYPVPVPDAVAVAVVCHPVRVVGADLLGIGGAGSAIVRVSLPRFRRVEWAPVPSRTRGHSACGVGGFRWIPNHAIFS
jgi:hypothetical protein